MIKLLAISGRKSEQEMLKQIVESSIPEADLLLASTMPSGLKKARSFNPDMILLDSAFIIQDETFFADKLRSDLLLSLIPVVILADSKQEIKTLIREMNIESDYFLARPYGCEDLLILIASMTRMKKIREILVSEKEQLKIKVKDSSRKLKDETEQRKTWEKELKTSNLSLERSRLAALNLMEDFTIEFEEHQKSQGELLRREEKYKELLTLFRSIADNISDMLWAKDLDKNYVFANKALCDKLLGASDTGEPIGKNDLYFASRERQTRPDDPEWHTFGEICADSDQVVLTSGQAQQFYEYGNVKGKFLYLDVRKSPLRNHEGVLIGTVGSGRDITGEIEIRKQLEESEMRLRQAQKISGLGNYVLDIKSNKWECSENLDRIFGIDKTFTHDFDTWVSVVHPDYRDEMVRYFVEDVIGKKEQFDKEYKIIRFNDKAERWVHGLGRLDPDNKGELAWMVGTIQDITPQKLIREEIEKLNNELEKRVKERTSQLEAANKELEAFSYSVSHDLRAPLRAVHGFTQILIEDYKSVLDEEGKRICSVIMENAVQMGKLVDDLLRFSRLNRIDIHFSEIDMNGLCRNVYKELASPEKREMIDFRTTDLHRAWGDPNLIRQVLVNLISNALKFSSYVDNVRISVTSWEENDSMGYSITDNGAGFNMKYRDKLFGVFQRLHSAREYEGTGVGLAIVQRIIHRHRGRVWAEGEVGKGATFSFTLPRKIENSYPWPVENG